MKILILKPSSLGDVIHALPVLRLLKRSRPEAEVHWWINEEFAPLIEGDPDIAGLFLFRRRRWTSPFALGEVALSIAAMRRERFDVVIDLQGLARSGTFAWLANGGILIGVDDPREGAPGYYDIAVRRPSALTHAVDWYLETLKPLHVPVTCEFDWLPPRPQVALRVRERWPVDGSRWIILNPGARWLNKRWPAAHFAALARLLSASLPDHRFAILGGKGDVELGREIASAQPKRCLDLTGQTSLAEMIEWTRLAELMVTNDTGPMHVAAALGKPVVAPFGPTEPRRTGPYGQVEQCLGLSLPCVPCMSPRCHWKEPIACLRGITPAAVESEVLRRLAGARQRE